MPTRAPKGAQPTPIFEIDSKGSSAVRSRLLAEHHGEANPASARIRKGSRVTRPLRSQEILAQRSNVPGVTSRVRLPPVQVTQKERETGKIRPELKRRLARMARRDRRHTGRGLFDAPDQRDVHGELSEAVRRAGEYDAWQSIAEPAIDDSIKDIVAKPGVKVRQLLDFFG
jgi:nucleolar protein 53